MIQVDADVCVLGSGFGGSLLALILDRIGLRPVLIDPATHPRFAIGESSTPIANRVLRDLCARYDLPRIAPLSTYGAALASYPDVTMGLKRGFSYFQHEPHRPFVARARHENELLVTASLDDFHSDTHWLRADVDAFLAGESTRAGIPLLDSTTTVDLVHDQAWRFMGERCGERVEVTAKFIVDASGPAAVVPNQLFKHDARPDHVEQIPLATSSRAIYSHFRGVGRWHDFLTAQHGRVDEHPFCCDHAALHHVLEDGWMWQLRFRNGLTSAGFVLDADKYPPRTNVSPQQEWDDLLARYPSIAEQFKGTEIVNPPGAICRTGRLQRCLHGGHGANWAALPNTIAFVDPLHSTGIAQTLCAIERLAGAFEVFHDAPRFQRAIHDSTAAIHREIRLIDKLVHGCYLATANFDVFATYAMLYFAAATTYEHRRHERQPTSDFLCADDRRLVEIVDQTYDELRRNRTELSVDGFAARFEQQLARAIEPYNIAGLCDPTVHNMYRYTAAPVERPAAPIKTLATK